MYTSLKGDTNCVFAKFAAQQEAVGTFKYVCDLQDLRVRTERSRELKTGLVWPLEIETMFYFSARPCVCFYRAPCLLCELVLQIN